MSKGVQFWYYTAKVPSRSIAVAKVSVPVMTPAQLTSVNNTVYGAGSLGVWKSATSLTAPPDFVAPDLNQAIEIHSDSAYFLGSQFFQITNVLSGSNTPMFYQHQLPAGVTQVTILDLSGNTIVVDSLLSNQIFYHSLDGSPYFVRYISSTGYLTTSLLRYDPVKIRSQYVAGGQYYQLTGRLLTTGDTSNIWLRFTDLGGYQVMPMYGYLPNTPWYPLVRFGMQPAPVDWSTQRFVLPPNILQATYVPGTILSSNLVEFERKNLYYDPLHLPDILVFDSNNVIKYALDGSAPNSPPRHGTLYNWKRGQIQSIDPANARVNLALDLDPTDIVYAFYNYQEPDVVYTALDINPFTNSAVKNKVIEFYVKFNGTNPARNIYHQILNNDGTAIAGATNDSSPGTGTNHVFAQVAVGASVSETQFTFTDIRQRGGGLAPTYQAIPQADSFFDLGYWDGKPYPIGGALVVNLPLSILNTLSRTDVRGKVESTIPMGALAVIRYFDEQGNEFL